MDVIVDYREVASGIPKILREMGVDFRVGELRAGDYLIEGKYVIERKSLSDLVNSIKSARVFRQIDLLTECSSEQPVLIIEGDWSEIDSRDFRIESLIGFEMMVQEAGIKVLSTRSKMHSAIAIKTLINHEPRSTVVVRPKKIRLDDPRIAMLCGIPGVGTKRAMKLLKEYKTIKRIVTADFDSLCNVVGPATAEKIVRVVEEPWVEE